MKGAIAVLLLAVLQAAMSNAATEPKTFFPDLKNNLTKIVWAHAVNNLKALEDNLNNANVMMLEGDVRMGLKVNETDKTKIVPIMSHDAGKESDLTLEEFVNKVPTNSTKGVKLDFKTTEAIEGSKATLEKLTKVSYPVFINADIVQGPGGNATEVKEEGFLKIAKEYSNLIVSVGWTTGWNNDAKNASYSDKDIETMNNTLKAKELKQPITYAVRAALAANSHSQMKKLVKDTNNTLTIWSAENDVVNATELSKLIKDVGVENVYLDVPEKLKKELDLNGASSMAIATMTVLGSLFVSLFFNGMPQRG